MQFRARRKDTRRVPRWQVLVLWTCALSLLVLVANRVPRFDQGDSGWSRSVPSQTSIKLLLKSLVLLQPPRARAFQPVQVCETRITVPPAPPIFVLSLNTRLYNRPPPTA